MNKLTIGDTTYRCGDDGKWRLPQVVVSTGGIRGDAVTRRTGKWEPVDRRTAGFLTRIQKVDKVLEKVREMFEVLFDEDGDGREDIDFNELHDAIIEYDGVEGE